jgi:hypothetical protein
MSRIVVTGSTSSGVPIYPRARFVTRQCRYQNHIHCADISSYDPFYRIRYFPLPSVLTSAASRRPQTATQITTISRSLRTMPDPVQRSASPYTDPTVKGPRSQQLTSGLSRSRLQDDKSKSSAQPGPPTANFSAKTFSISLILTTTATVIPNNKVNKTALHPSGVE